MYFVLFYYEVFDGGFGDGEGRVFGKDILHGVFVECAIGLSAGTPDGGAFAFVQHAVVDAGAVDSAAHDAVECIDFAYQVPLAMPPMAGLHDISPMVRLWWVMSRVRAPRRADADAASQPACPPPMMMVSNEGIRD